MHEKRRAIFPTLFPALAAALLAGETLTFPVLIRDNDTGATTTVVAQAYYYDGWS